MLPIELLHGVTFGLAWAASTINCKRISPPGLETTTQAIFQVRHFLLRRAAMWSSSFAVLPCGLSNHASSVAQHNSKLSFLYTGLLPFSHCSLFRPQGLFSGVGLGLGGVVGGVIYSRLGAPAVFASAALVLAVGWCACMAVQALAGCLRGRERRT